MKRHVLSVTVASMFATALIAAQGTSQQQQQQQQQQREQQRGQEVTLTGCVTQGSSPTVFLFEGSREGAQGAAGSAQQQQQRAAEKKSYVLVAGTEDLQLKNHLNHEVRITGMAENKTPPTPPAGQKVEEKDLPKLTAKSITMVADRCTTTLGK
jgi:hypothetical protein